jgi:hypothetical protein
MMDGDDVDVCAHLFDVGCGSYTRSKDHERGNIPAMCLEIL